MATLQPNPTRDTCLKVTGEIICKLIETGKLPSDDIDTLGSNYAKLYKNVYACAIGKSSGIV